MRGHASSSWCEVRSTRYPSAICHPATSRASALPTNCSQVRGSYLVSVSRYPYKDPLKCVGPSTSKVPHRLFVNNDSKKFSRRRRIGSILRSHTPPIAPTQVTSRHPRIQRSAVNASIKRPASLLSSTFQVFPQSFAGHLYRVSPPHDPVPHQTSDASNLRLQLETKPIP